MMSQIKTWLAMFPRSATSASIILALIGANLLFNIVANASFKVSAEAPRWNGFFIWQVIGNLAGLITVLTLTALLRYMPLNVAFTVTTGLAVFGIDIVASGMLFHESIRPIQWVGTALVVAGIALMVER
jgi:multidrug transporter EmrE-like cation transporter